MPFGAAFALQRSNALPETHQTFRPRGFFLSSGCSRSGGHDGGGIFFLNSRKKRGREKVVFKIMPYYFFGFNGFKQFGNETDPEQEVQRLIGFDRIPSLDLSWSKFGYVEDNGALTIKGLLKEASSGGGSITSRQSSEESYIEVACSLLHVAAISDSGFGKLFEIREDRLNEILTVPSGEHKKIAKCDVGESDAVFITDDGKAIWVSLSSSVLESPVLPIAWKVIAVSCGKEHVLLLSETGTVYSFGKGRF